MSRMRVIDHVLRLVALLEISIPGVEYQLSFSFVSRVLTFSQHESKRLWYKAMYVPADALSLHALKTFNMGGHPLYTKIARRGLVQQNAKQGLALNDRF